MFITSKGNGSPGMQTSPTPPPTAEKGKYTYIFSYTVASRAIFLKEKGIKR